MRCWEKVRIEAEAAGGRREGCRDREDVRACASGCFCFFGATGSSSFLFLAALAWVKFPVVLVGLVGGAVFLVVVVTLCSSLLLRVVVVVVATERR